MTTPRINLDQLHDAMELVTAADFIEVTAGVSRQDGRIWVATDCGGDDLPDDFDNEQRYLPVPNKRDLDLGRELVFAFVRSHAPDREDAVRGIFRSRGAYGRYKVLLECTGLLDDWHAFEHQRTLEALTEWAHENGFAVDRGEGKVPC